jgi:hypothetical protein
VIEGRVSCVGEEKLLVGGRKRGRRKVEGRRIGYRGLMLSVKDGTWE